MSKTVAERLQEAAARGELSDCRNWEDVARKLDTTARVLRRIRQKLGTGAPAIGWTATNSGWLNAEQERSIAQAFASGPRVRDEYLDERLVYAKTAERRADVAQTIEYATSPHTANSGIHSELDVDVSEWDEEPTEPGIASLWGVVPGLPPSDFGARRTHWSEAANNNWRALEQPATSRKLTREDCPDGSLILWASDVHIPIHDDTACRLMVECAERSGVSHVIAGGDILDMNCLSKHAKESRRTVEHATILEEVEPGRWLLDWFATKKTDLILGNHEDRLKRFIDENPAFHGSLVSNFAQVTNLPAGINVIPQGGEVRLGSLSARHLDAEFKNSSGGKYPAQRVLEMLPDQSTVGGHVHRIHSACRTTRDEDGINRTHKAWTMGHMSHEHMHSNYVSSSPNWQQGFGMIRVTWEGARPRFSVYQIEVMRDRDNRPYFEWGGVWYR